MTVTRIYAVRGNPHPDGVRPSRLIRAANSAQVGRHIVKDTIDITVATQDDIVACLSDGVKVEDASDSSTSAKE